MAKLKPSDIFIAGHPRAGNNYLQALVSKNFFAKKWAKIPGSHRLLEWHQILPSIRYLYIYRSSEDVIKSLFEIRKILQIKEDDFEVFLETDYADMIDSDICGEVKKFRFGDEHIEVKSRDYFVGVHEMPFEYWQHHQQHWFKLASRFENVHLVHYDDLLRTFQSTMRGVALFLGMPQKKAFKNVDVVVGYMPIERSIYNINTAENAEVKER